MVMLSFSRVSIAAVIVALTATVSFAGLPAADQQEVTSTPYSTAHPPNGAESTAAATDAGSRGGFPGRDQSASKGYDWGWRRAGAADYAGAILGIAGTIYVEQEYGTPEAQWKSRNGFDEGIRDALRLGTESSRLAAHTAGDVIMGLMIAAPVLDSLATLGVRDSRWEALWETEMINLESFTVTSLLSSLLQSVILPRERPFVRNCSNGRCEDGQINRSFPSGHVAFAFTGAGLVCNHHDYQSLYGNPAADRAACATGLVLSTAEAFLRIMADRHYATDVLAGTAIGLFSGYLLPRWLTYNWPRRSTQSGADGKPALRQLTVSPQVYADGGGVNCSFRF